MTPTAPLPHRLDQLARLWALGWDDVRIAGETGLSLHGVSGARWRLRRAWRLVGRCPDSPVAWADVVLRVAIRSYVAAHQLAAERACLHCTGVPLERAHREEDGSWAERETLRLCRGCWRQWRTATWRV